MPLTPIAPPPGAAPPSQAIDKLIVLASDWYWEQDAQCRYTRVVEPALPDVQPESVPGCIGMCRWDLPESRALTMTWDEHRALLAARRSFHDFQHVFKHAGADRCVSVSGAPVFDADGSFRGYRGTSRDVTDDWRQRTMLRDAQALLGVAAVLGRFGAWSIDVRTRQGVWTDQARAIHQAPLSHVCTIQQALEMYAPEYRESMREAFRRCALDGTPYDLEVEILTTAGDRVWVRVIGVPVHDEQGRIVRVQGACQDIHTSKMAAEAHRALAERLRVTVDSLIDGFATLDRDWRITYANDTALAMLGLDRPGVLGRSLWDIFPDARDTAFEENYRRAMEHRESRTFEAYHAPLDLWLRANAFPLGTGIGISFTDATATVQARLAMERMNQELERRVQERTGQLKRLNEELSAFTMAVAHDLRAPLAGIGGFVEVMAERVAAMDDPKMHHYLSRVQHGVARMAEQLQALLELSRIGRTEFEPRPVDLSLLAREAVEALRAAAPHRQAEVVLQEKLVVCGDARLLRTLVDNLVGNAWKFSAGRQPARIAFGRAEDGAFFVRDNGTGFDMAHAADLFAPFRRLHASDEFPGVGIGLASARRVVERHGGSIRAESQPDVGTVFWFTLPQVGA